jgi:hypothetical protein
MIRRVKLVMAGLALAGLSVGVGSAAVTPSEPARLAAIAGVPVTFVDSQEEVLDRIDGCARVRGGGIAVTLTRLTVTGPTAVQVPISGFEACLGATWLTYVIEHQRGHRRVTGDTGVYGVA